MFQRSSGPFGTRRSGEAADLVRGEHDVEREQAERAGRQ